MIDLRLEQPKSKQTSRETRVSNAVQSVTGEATRMRQESGQATRRPVEIKQEVAIL